MKKKGRQRFMQRSAKSSPSKVGLASIADSAMSAASGGGMSGLGFGKIGSFLQQLGGLQGIFGAITKARTVFTSIRQFFPMIKFIWGTFAKKKDDTEIHEDPDADGLLAEDGLLPPSPIVKKKPRKRRPSSRRKQRKKAAA